MIDLLELEISGLIRFLVGTYYFHECNLIYGFNASNSDQKTIKFYHLYLLITMAEANQPIVSNSIIYTTSFKRLF